MKTHLNHFKSIKSICFILVAETKRHTSRVPGPETESREVAGGEGRDVGRCKIIFKKMICYTGGYNLLKSYNAQQRVC